MKRANAIGAWVLISSRSRSTTPASKAAAAGIAAARLGAVADTLAMAYEG